MKKKHLLLQTIILNVCFLLLIFTSFAPAADAMGESSSASDTHRRLPFNNTASTIAASGTITVTAPFSGGTKWEVGTDQCIEWETTGTVGNVRIEFSADNGATWLIIVDSTPNDTIYCWTVPNMVSSQCLVRVSESAGGPSDTCDDAFKTIATGTAIELLTPNGGESWQAWIQKEITWSNTGNVGAVRIEYTNDNGASWNVIRSATPNDGSHLWYPPSPLSTQCRIRIREASDLVPVDISDTTFSITGVPPTLTVLSPNGGESLLSGNPYSITWSSSGTVGDVMIEYSTSSGSSWTPITTATTNDGAYIWTIPEVDSTTCLVRISGAADNIPVDTSNAIFSISLPTPQIVLNHSRLNFGATPSGVASYAESLVIDNIGDGQLNWSATDNATWLNISPSSGTNYSIASVSVNPFGMAVGTYTATIQVSDPNATNTPQTVLVNMIVHPDGSTNKPFGEFAIVGDSFSGSIPITGWALDDIGVQKVALYSNGSYIADAVMVEGARTDIEAAYPSYPRHYKAGWGYMMLSHFLSGGGNGSYTINAVAVDIENNWHDLGSQTIVIDNNNAVKPFGAIDTPSQGGTASGYYRSSGWVLTPLPNMIDTDGSDITVYVDGVWLGHPHYNMNRPDVAGLFPNYLNSAGAGGYFYIDTFQYSNGIHSIYWIARDNAGNTDGIGSRFFMVNNPSSTDLASVAAASQVSRVSGGRMPRVDLSDWTTNVDNIPVEPTESVGVIKGFHQNEPQKIFPDDNDSISIDIKALERVEIHFGNPDGIPANKALNYTGYLKVDKKLKPLPIGSTLDMKKGIFYWSPGLGFTGEFELLFFEKDDSGLVKKNRITVRIK